jgi:hypothetical protein
LPGDRNVGRRVILTVPMADDRLPKPLVDASDPRYRPRERPGMPVATSKKGRSMSATNPRASLVARVLGGGVLVALAFGAHAQAFNAKTGAWEMTTTISGMALPPDVLAKMPADRRAMAEKMMADRNGQPVVHKSCVTKEDLAQDKFARASNPQCTIKTVTRTSTKLVQETVCPGPPATNGTLTFELKSPEAVVGTADQQRGDGSKIHVGIVGRWLGASCADTEAIDGAPKR